MKNSSVLAAPPQAASPASPFAALWSALRAVLRTVRVERRSRRLRLCESLPLGEKRLIAVVEFEEQRFLLAATAENICLLQSLGPAPEKLPAERP
jgi:flagellar biogenesis protein FliO